MILNMSPVGSNLSHTSKYWPSSICIPHSLAPPKIGKETTKLYEIIIIIIIINQFLTRQMPVSQVLRHGK